MGDAEAPAGAIVVVTTMPLSDEARAELSELLGPDYLVVDVKQAPSTANIVLTTIISPQLIGMLRGQFPRARILLTELHDAARGIRYAGPITRALESGPDGYFVAHDLEGLSPIVQTEARLQLAGSTRPSTPMIDTGHDRDPTVHATGGPPSPVTPAGIVWLHGGAPPPDAGAVVDLHHVDDAVAGLLATSSPRASPLWVTLVAETAIHLVRERQVDVWVDVADLPSATRAQLVIHVGTEDVAQSSWPDVRPG